MISQVKIIRQITNLFWLWTVLGTAWAWFFPEHFVWFLGKLPGTELKLTALGLGVIMLSPHHRELPCELVASPGLP
jgi:hypothetical protein